MRDYVQLSCQDCLQTTKELQEEFLSTEAIQEGLSESIKGKTTVVFYIS